MRLHSVRTNANGSHFSTKPTPFGGCGRATIFVKSCDPSGQREKEPIMRAPRLLVLTSVILISPTASFVAAQNSAQPVPSPRTIGRYLHLPLAFERYGTAPNETWVAHGQGYAIGVERGRATIRTWSKVHQEPVAVSLEFRGANAPAAVTG